MGIAVGVVLLGLGREVSAQEVADTRFSHDRGFYEAPFELSIVTDTGEATIHYTLDGSLPSPFHGVVYEGPIPIDGTAVVRAMAFRAGMLPTDVDTQTYLFIEDVLDQPADIPGWPRNMYSTGNGEFEQHDYEMDPAIVQDPAYAQDLRDGLLEIPSLSLVMDKDDFWEVYDAPNTTAAVERPVSVELLYADDPSANEQVDGGLKSHSHDRLKRSMRLHFRREYGDGAWDSSIFRNAPRHGGSAVDRYDRIVLRGGNNRSWARVWNPDRTTYARDQWYRDTQVAMSGVGSRGTFVHLYVNGLYWGLYNPSERPDAWFTSSYLGGHKTDWFSTSHGGDQAGDDTRYDYLVGALKDKDMTVAANYVELQAHLDLENFCDYLIVSWMTGVTDWPQNNWWLGHRTNPPQPARYFGWDCEWAWDTTKNSNQGAWVHPDFRADASGGIRIKGLWHSARVNDDFLMLFADRVYRHCFHNGAASDAESRRRWAELNGFIRNAIVAESARWGDSLSVANGHPTRTRDEQWVTEVDRLDGLMDGNADRLVNALRAEGYYPSIDPPEFLISGTTVDVTRLTVEPDAVLAVVRTGDQGSVYVTLDGSDPREPGGGIASEALAFGAGDTVTIPGTTRIRARTRSDGEWSALHEVVVFVPIHLGDVKFTEIMYHPTPEPMPGERSIGSIIGDAGALDPGYAGRALVEFEADLPSTLSGEDWMVIRGSGQGANDGRYVIDQVLYEDDGLDAPSSIRTRKVLLRESLLDEDPSPAVAEFQSDGDRYEFLEVKNTGPVPLPLTGLGLSRGPEAVFPDGAVLDPGQQRVMAAEPWTFAERYPTAPPTLPLGKGLDNDGERVELGFWTGEQADVLSLLPHVGGGGSITLDAVPPRHPPDARIRITRARRPLNNGSYRVVAVTGQVVYVDHVFLAEGAGARAEVVDVLNAVEYEHRSPWPLSADGYGYSLVPTNASPTGVQDNPATWRASAEVSGSPGADDPEPVTIPILVNEILTHTDAPLRDAIELYNPNPFDVGLAGWSLTDDHREPQKWIIPVGASIPTGGYRVFYEGHYQGTNLLFDAHEFGSAFSLSSLGEEIYVFSPSLRTADGFSFDASANGVSLGRQTNSTGSERLVARTSFTHEAPNTEPLIGPVVFSEIHYNPLNDDPDPDLHDHEFVEIVNISPSAVALFDPAHPENTWRVSGIDFAFPSESVTLAAGEAAVLVRDTIDVDTFRARVGLASTVQLFSFEGRLSGSERLRLLRPDEPVASGPNIGEIGWIEVDSVRYDDEPPWPPQADGEGPSLERIDVAAYGDEPLNWRASALHGGTPGLTETTDAPLLAVSLRSIRITAAAPAAATPTSLEIWNAGTDTIDYAIASGAPWIRVQPPSGMSTGALDRVLHQVTFDPLPVGLHQATVTVSDPEAFNHPASVSVTVTVISNQAPEVVAIVPGEEPVVPGDPVVLQAEVWDDDFPDFPLSFSWTVLDKPDMGTVLFSPDSRVEDPTVTFAVPGDYTLLLSADDGQHQHGLALVVSVSSQPQWIERRVGETTDDAEERSDGSMERLDSSDLEMTQEQSVQTVGIRFQDVRIPAYARILEAHVQFAAKAGSSETTSLLFRGEESPHAAPFADVVNSISSRTRTRAVATWSPVPAWTAGESGPDQQTPDLSFVLQEIVDHAEWTSGGPVALVITGTGIRSAWSYDGNASAAPLLQVRYLVDPTRDTDGDNLPDTWEIAFFDNLSQASDDPTSDADEDGSSDLHEYLAGTDPRDPQSRLRLESASQPEGSQSILTWQGQPGTSFSVLSTSNLVDPQWSVRATGVQGFGTLNTTTVQVDRAEAFFRIVVE